MSIHDQHPTQYFGPGPAVEFIGPHGKPIRVTQEQFNALSERGALTDEQMLHAKQDGLSLAELLEEANKLHRPGCASSRNRGCTCDYIAQWDRPEYTAPTFRKDLP